MTLQTGVRLSDYNVLQGIAHWYGNGTGTSIQVSHTLSASVQRVWFCGITYNGAASGSGSFGAVSLGGTSTGVVPLQIGKTIYATGSRYAELYAFQLPANATPPITVTYTGTATTTALAWVAFSVQGLSEDFIFNPPNVNENALLYSSTNTGSLTSGYSYNMLSSNPAGTSSYLPINVPMPIVTVIGYNNTPVGTLYPQYSSTDLNSYTAISYYGTSGISNSTSVQLGILTTHGNTTGQSANWQISAGRNCGVVWQPLRPYAQNLGPSMGVGV